MFLSSRVEPMSQYSSQYTIISIVHKIYSPKSEHTLYEPGSCLSVLCLTKA